jgi:hypothetical protein
MASLLVRVSVDNILQGKGKPFDCSLALVVAEERIFGGGSDDVGLVVAACSEWPFLNVVVATPY